MGFADPPRAGADPFAAPFTSVSHLDLPLPPGPYGLPRAFVVQNQRSRILAGALDAVAEHGYPAATVAHIIRPATISRATFYEHFPNKEACVLAAYDLIVEWFARRLAEAVEDAESWPQAVMAAIDTALGLLAADRRLVRFCAVEILCVGSLGSIHYAASIDRLADSLRLGRDSCPWGADLPPEFEEMAIGGVIRLIGRHERLEEADRLTGLGSDLAYFLLTPYLGVAEAQALATEAV